MDNLEKYKKQREEELLNDEFSTVTDEHLVEFARVNKIIVELATIKRKVALVREGLELLRYSNHWDTLDEVNAFLDKLIKGLE